MSTATPSTTPPTSATARHFHTGAHYLQNLLATVAPLGVDPARLLERVGLTPGDLDDPHARINDVAKLTVWEHLAAEVDDVHVGLRIGQAAPLGRWGLTEQLLFHSPTFGDGLEQTVRFATLMADGKHLHLDRLGAQALYTVSTDSTPPSSLANGWRHLIESDLVYALRLARLFVSPALSPSAVWFAHPAPAGTDRSVYAGALGGPVRFEQPTNAIQFDAVWLDAPLSNAVPALRTPLEVAAAAALARAEAARSDAAHVEAYIRLDPGTVTLADVSERLGVSTRTLQRRLRNESTSFQAILDAVRREYADAFLRDDEVPLGEVSYRLGFSEPTALYRAVRRWFGVTAMAYRDQAA